MRRVALGGMVGALVLFLWWGYHRSRSIVDEYDPYQLPFGDR